MKFTTSRHISSIMFILLGTARADVSSPNELSDGLVKTEELLLKQVELYITSTKNEINRLKQMEGELRSQLNSLTSDEDDSESISLNTFKSVRRLVRDWKKIRPLVTESQSKNEAQRNLRAVSLPTEKDLEVAAEALITLQHYQNISATSLAKGEFPGFNLKRELNAEDCFELGRFAYSQLNYKLSIQWMNEALVRCRSKEEYKKTDTESKLFESLERKIYGYLPYSIFREGEMERAVNMSINLIKTYSQEDHEKTWNNLELFKSLYRFNPDPAVYATEDNKIGIVNSTYGTDDPRFRSLCGSGAPPGNNAVLKCRYVSRSAFSRLARIKEEEINLDPKMSIFRNAIYETEIEILKKIATVKSQNMTIGSKRTQDVKIQLDPRKFVKEVKVKVEDTDIVQKILKRSEDMTGLSLAGTDHIYVLLYIISGQVSTHHDYDHGTKRDPLKGNRIASLLYHMSDFEGGETAFPELGVSLKPGKGSASVWYNLFANGGDLEKSLHGGCPVMRGAKWVAAVALHTLGNEFNRPCALNPSE